MMLSAILGVFSFSAFAEGFASAITVYALCKGKGATANYKKCSGSRGYNHKKAGGKKA